MRNCTTLLAGTWSNTGSLNTARAYHTATLLRNGNPLIAGGSSNTGTLASAELYDSFSGTWNTTGSLNTARYQHTATLLPNGKILVAGGQFIGFPANTELYDTGLGFNPNWQPLLVTVSPAILPSGGELTASGALFQGISEASGGKARKILHPITRRSNC